MPKTFLSRFLHATVAGALVVHAGNAAALEFMIGDNPLRVENLFTIGASWRMQDRDPSLIGKSSLYRLQNPGGGGLCYTRVGDDGINGPDPGDDITMVAGDIPAGCGTTNFAAIREYVSRPGSYNPSGDNGNLNFDKHDLVHAVAKLTSDISFSYADFNFFVRPIAYFDANYTDFETNYPDTTLQDRHQSLPSGTEQRVGTDLELLDYNVSKLFTVADHDFNVKVGNQVLNWGESSLLVFNSINVINPLDATKVRFPGADLKEFFQPVGMVVVGTDIVYNISLEMFYQYDWKALRIDPPGTFFSQSDTLGEGGRYAQNGQGREPDDPLALYRGIDGPHSAGILGSTSSRIVRRNFAEEAKRAPSDTGQYGAKLGLFLEDFNNGTELAFYYANYHSRLPIASTMAGPRRSCITSAASLAPLVGECGYRGPGQDADNPLTLDENEETVPVDEITLLIEYPENVQMYGVSFNTTVGDWAWSGEYAHRPALPTQIHTLDLSVAALGAVFPREDVVIPGLATLGQRASFPDFVSVYRGKKGSDGIFGYGPGDYIRGYEELETGQLNITFLRLIGGDNPLRASQITFLLETGMNIVYGLPGLDELQFQGGGVDTPISTGADVGCPGEPTAGRRGINPRDVRTSPGAIRTSRYDPQNTGFCAGNPAATPDPRQNATAHQDLDGFGTDQSFGYRILNLMRWDSAFMGANLETLSIIQHDVHGTTPGLGTNFIDGRKQFAFGVRFDYLATYIGEVRYAWNTGGANRDGLRDRDNIFVTLGYQF
jgi:hypothetical protein